MLILQVRKKVGLFTRNTRKTYEQHSEKKPKSENNKLSQKEFNSENKLHSRPRCRHKKRKNKIYKCQLLQRNTIQRMNQIQRKTRKHQSFQRLTTNNKLTSLKVRKDKNTHTRTENDRNAPQTPAKRDAEHTGATHSGERREQQPQQHSTRRETTDRSGAEKPHKETKNMKTAAQKGREAEDRIRKCRRENLGTDRCKVGTFDDDCSFFCNTIANIDNPRTERGRKIAQEEWDAHWTE